MPALGWRCPSGTGTVCLVRTQLSRMPSWRAWCAGALLAGTVVGCAPDETSDGTASTESAVVPATAQAPVTTVLTTIVDDAPLTSGEPAPAPAVPAESIDWSAPLIGGGTLDMRGYADRAVMLWFWAPY